MTIGYFTWHNIDAWMHRAGRYLPAAIYRSNCTGNIGKWAKGAVCDNCRLIGRSGADTLESRLPESHATKSSHDTTGRVQEGAAHSPTPM